jgi:hypothetical protein
MTKNKGRVVGLDVHPDSFAGAIVEGSDPAQARVLSSSTRVQLEQLGRWALRHTRAEDTLVLEASGNAFAVAARLRAIGRKVEILDSHCAGKVGKVYCVSGGGEGVDPGQATVALDVKRTLCAFGEGLPPLSPQCAHAPACAAGVDAGAEDVAATVAR